MIELRELEETDTGRIAELVNNYNIFKQLGDSIPFPYSEDDAKAFLEFIANDDSQKVFGIIYNTELVGVTGLILQRDVHRLSAELGYWLGEEYWGLGIMSEAVKRMVERGFSDYNLVRIFARVFENNNGSMRVLEKAGFVLEGVFRKAVVKSDVIRDEYRYAILND